MNTPEESEIALRRATNDDAEQMLRWRNDESVRLNTEDSHLITFEEHTCWLERVLKDSASALLIGSLNGRPIGVLRYDVDQKRAEALISIYLVPSEIGKGFGRRLLEAGEGWIQKNYSLKCLRAVVKPGNIRSEKMFENNGFRRKKGGFVKDLS